ncbi:hypothetical protein ACAG96_02080 [Candidatus Izemoplasma sp. B36]|uniref:hypothetical protein n=1 Tax=Candidatus Izemoplasma sp. B36 TaxID=3242468 RepID=UPI0035592682
MTKDKVVKNFDNFETYEDKLKMASDKELKMFNDFYQSIEHRAKTHKQATLNNLHDSKESLSTLKEKAEKLKDSVFFHEESVIVDRQSIISKTEELIHKENRNILDYEFNQAGDRIESLDYLNKAMIQTKYNFFDLFRTHYANQIMDFDKLYEFFQKKKTEFDEILNGYNKEILKHFQELDDDITDMDTKISLLIQQKNSKLNDINTFYTKEMKNYLDNQLTFTIEDDPTSLTIQALISDKMVQLDTFKNHLLEQEEKVKKILNEEYQIIYEKTLDRLLRRKGNLLIDDTTFFYHPEEVIHRLKQEIVDAEEKEYSILKSLINKFNKIIKYKEYRKAAEKRARKMTSEFNKTKKGIYLEYQKDSRNLIFQIEKYFRLYLELLKIDPFLAQIIGDNSTKIIKDEINFLRILQMNKEHKINVNFDIKTLKLKQQINEIEAKLKYRTEKMMHLQDIDLINTIKDLKLFYINHHGNSYLIENSLIQEKYMIERLEKAINYHMKYLVDETNLNRKFLSIITQILESDIRLKESHNIKVVDAASDIKLALKEYDVLALHFNTLYENEKRFLVSQSNRVSEETKINNEFILTTFENQMRFASEQIMLANDEYRLRVEAILTAIEEERNYYFDIIRNKTRKYKEREQNISDEYQAKLYHNTYNLSETTDKSFRKAIEKQIAKNKKLHDAQMSDINELIANDTGISEAKRKLRELDAHFEVAIQDAKIIKDDTIKEMTELYTVAESKFNTLKPYLENKVNILDPTFYKSLEKIKERHQYKLKAAEIELEDKTKTLIQAYLQVYYEDKPEINRELYLSQIEQLETERDQIKAQYEKNIIDSDSLYYNKLQMLEKESKNITTKLDSALKLAVNKHERTITQIQNELAAVEKKYEGIQDKQSVSFQTEINNLTKEYTNSYNQNQKYYNNLSSAFNKILDSYYPYLKVAKNNKVIKHIVRENNKKIKIKKSKEFKKLKKESKTNDYLLDS